MFLWSGCSLLLTNHYAKQYGYVNRSIGNYISFIDIVDSAAYKPLYVIDERD